MAKKALFLLLGIVLLEISLRGIGAVNNWVKENRGRVIQEELESESIYRILAVGESTTQHGGNASWPAQLENILNQQQSRIRFKVYNEGIGGVNSTYILARLKRNLGEYRPHMVISMMGANDEELTIIYSGEEEGNFVPEAAQKLRIFRLLRLLWSSYRTWLGDAQEEGAPEGAKRSKALYRDPDYDPSVIEQFLRKHHIRQVEKSPDPSAEDTLFKEAIRLGSGNPAVYAEMAQICANRGDLDSAVQYLQKATAIKPDKNYYISLAYYYQQQDQLVRAEEMAKKAIGLSPFDYMLYIELARIYFLQDNFKGAKDAYLVAIPLTPENPHNDALGEIWKCFEDSEISKKELEEIYKKYGFSVRFNPDLPEEAITQENHRLMYDILKGRKIRYGAMNYPTKSIDELKRFFRDKKDILFISNEDNFNKALLQRPYEYYFIDRCYDLFGHGTAQGNRLIAESAAKAILEEFNLP